MSKQIKDLPRLLEVTSFNTGVNYVAISLDDSYDENLRCKRGMLESGYDNRMFCPGYNFSFEDCCEYVKNLGYSYLPEFSLKMASAFFKRDDNAK